MAETEFVAAGDKIGSGRRGRAQRAKLRNLRARSEDPGPAS